MASLRDWFGKAKAPAADPASGASAGSALTGNFPSAGALSGSEPDADPSPAKTWLTEWGPYFAVSAMAHAVLFVFALMIAFYFIVLGPKDEPPTFEPVADTRDPDPNLVHFDLSHPDYNPSELDQDSLLVTDPANQTAEINDNSEFFEARGGGKAPKPDSLALGGLGGFSMESLDAGTAIHAPGGVADSAVGFGANLGAGGDGSGFGSRGAGSREEYVGKFGGTRQTERSVAAALNWLARHQNPDGSWSITSYGARCHDATCTYPGTFKSDVAGTALGLLPFLAAGCTHKDKGPNQKLVSNSLNWLLKKQNANGDMASGSPDPMYTHGLATIALCEAYGLTQDSALRDAAQRAVEFIETAQNREKGGWRYVPQEDGDVSVTGWQIMALKSAKMAGLKVNDGTFKLAEKFVKSAASGNSKGLFAYQPNRMGPSTPMTAVGLLCTQYLGAPRDDPALIEGTQHLMAHMPQIEQRDLYYWYYATQVMHNMPGTDWDTWNRRMRKILVDTQIKEGCATGSWDPQNPFSDQWGSNGGGRLMMTSLSCLTLEIYYRYLPLYKLDGKAGEGEGKRVATAP